MERRLILAIALSILIIFAFQFLAPKPSLPPTPAPVEKAPVAQATHEKESAISAYAPSVAPIEEKELEVETDRYIITFSNVGGAIKSVRLKDYKNLNSDEPFALVQLSNPKEYIFNISSLSSKVPLDSVSYNVNPVREISGFSNGVNRKENTITYSIRTSEFEITKSYILHNLLYYIELHLFIKNLTSSAKEFNYYIIGGSGLSETNLSDKRFLEVISKINEKVIGFKKPKAGRIMYPGIVNWTALKSKYFSLILKPFIATKGQFYSEPEEGNFVIGVESDRSVIQSDTAIENRYLLYAGPSREKDLKEAGQGLEETINYGFFGGISRILISIMWLMHKVVRSWGVSIILLSVFLNIILFPLTMKSFKSMQKMQELHPEMEKLKIQYKNNPQKLNKEIMELYKKYKINPFSGCLPMLLQMPIFIALYQALMKSIELRATKFLWIQDLSMPDAVKIPISLPLIGNHLNVLPIVMVIAMVVQQKISTKTMGSAVTPEQREQQKMMLIVMPIVFGFIFYSMPSGLVLYWVINTVLTIVEQGAILKKA